MIKTPVAEQPGTALWVTGIDGPLNRRQRIPLGIAELCQAADIKSAFARVLKAGQRRMLAEDRRRMGPVKCLTEPQPLRHLRQQPPVGFGFPGGRNKRTLTGNTAFRIGHGAVFFAPALGGEQNMGKGCGIRVRQHVGDDHQRTVGQRPGHAIAFRH